MRRLPVYLLVDTSGSMKGEPIAAANHGLRAMVSTLKQDPFALESVWISIMTYDRDVKEVVALTSLDGLEVPELETPESGPTMLGKALEFLLKKLDTDIVKNCPEQKGDWRPLLFVITDGKPSDNALYEEMAAKVKARRFASIVACAAGQSAKTEPLKLLTDNVYSLATMDGSSFAQFFKWVSQSIAQGVTQGEGLGAASEQLPPPPAELSVVF